MRLIGVAALTLLAMVATAAAQDKREDALREIARVLVEIDKTMPSESEMITIGPNALQDRIDAALQRVEMLKDYLANNEYVRVSGFELGIPMGIAVSFEFRTN